MALKTTSHGCRGSTSNAGDLSSLLCKGFTPSKSECRLQAIFQVVEKTGQTGKIYSEFFNVFRKLVMEIR